MQSSSAVGCAGCCEVAAKADSASFFTVLRMKFANERAEKKQEHLLQITS